jgi:acetoin:2,6-dichlorophenolindophenol oxidoreductase subunit alpha
MRARRRSASIDGQMRSSAESPELFFQMSRMRHFELALADLWRRGLISGEMHLGIGEEGVIAGTLAHAVDGDAIALDHRSTPALVARGTSLTALAFEMLGSDDGLCHGRGGHMHLFDPERLAASSGIVGAAAPLGCGFAMAAKRLRGGRVAFAFFGEGAANQGMLLESLNLAVAWSLPVVFVCKDSGFAITTPSRSVTGGSLVRRARSFGMPAVEVDGSDAEAVARRARRAVDRARSGHGPTFVLARCHHRDGHFLGDPLVRLVTDPVGEAREMTPPLAAAALSSPGASWRRRVAGGAGLGRAVAEFSIDRYLRYRDPLARAGRRLPRAQRTMLATRARREVAAAVHEATRSAA